MNKSLNIGIVGASGNTGGELCRLLLGHANVQEIIAATRTEQSLRQIHPNLSGSGLRFCGHEALLQRAKEGGVDVVFLCSPAGEAMTMAQIFLDANARVIDLGPDFRFAEASQYELTYGKPHRFPNLLHEAVYGLTEWNRAAIRRARLVANPGCFAITCLLSLAPCFEQELLVRGKAIYVSAVNGTTGASVKAVRETHHAFAANGILSYSMEGHRHGPEIEAQLKQRWAWNPTVILSTSHGPFPRGIQVVISGESSAGRKLSREKLVETYVQYYGKGSEGEHFVVINDLERQGAKNDKEYYLYPNVARLAGSNFCQIGLDYDKDTNHIKIVGAIDNLGKGAAGSAIQNMNVMFGLEETTGLQAYGL